MTQKKHVSWDEAMNATFEVYKQARALREFDHVVAISRGGLPMGVKLSHYLGAGLGMADVTHYDGEERQDSIEVARIGLDKVREGDSVLLFDDLVDTGKTLRRLMKRWEEYALDFSFVTATWFVKPRSMIGPDIWVEKTDKWVVFPWEEP